MKATISAITLLAAASTTAAFAPATPAFTRVASPLAAEPKKELVLDTNFDEVDLVTLLGLKRLKKKARKGKAKTNKGN